MRDLNIEGSNRVMQRTAERRSSSPCHSPSTPMPIGVMAPMPVITTRRGKRSAIVYRTILNDFPALPPYRLTALLNVPPDPSQCARCDAVHEHRTDDVVRCRGSDQRPARTAPFMHD